MSHCAFGLTVSVSVGSQSGNMDPNDETEYLLRLAYPKLDEEYSHVPLPGWAFTCESLMLYAHTATDRLG